MHSSSRARKVQVFCVRGYSIECKKSRGSGVVYDIYCTAVCNLDFQQSGVDGDQGECCAAALCCSQVKRGCDDGRKSARWYVFIL